MLQKLIIIEKEIRKGKSKKQRINKRIWKKNFRIRTIIKIKINRLWKWNKWFKNREFKYSKWIKYS